MSPSSKIDADNDHVSIDPQTAHAPKWKRWLRPFQLEPKSDPTSYTGVFAALLAITVVELLLIAKICVASTCEGVMSSWLVAHGHAELNAYQSRIVGPFAVLAISDLFKIKYATAHSIFFTCMLSINNFIVFVGARRYAFKKGLHKGIAWSFVLGNIILFIALQDKLYLYDWDLVDLSTMFAFAYCIFTSARRYVFVLLFLVALLNRESALFISGWLILDGLIVSGNVDKRRNWRNVYAGLALTGSGLIWTHFLRTTMLRSEPADITQHAPMIGGEIFGMQANIHNFLHPLTTANILPDIFVVLMSLLYIRFRSLWAGPPRVAVAVGLLLLVMFSSLFVCGVLTESRVFFEFIPFILFMYFVPSKTSSKLTPRKILLPNAHVQED